MSKQKAKAAPRRERPAVADAPAPGIFGSHPKIAALVFLAVSLVVFFAPLLFQGKVFLPPDNIASHSHKTYLDEVFATGEYPLWTPYLFSGMPSLGSMIAAPYTNPFSLLLTPFAGNSYLVVYYFLIGVFTFFLARRRTQSVFAALFAAVSFVYCTHVIGWVMAGHNSKLATCVFLPAILLLVDRLLDRPSALTFGWLGLAVGLSIVTSHMQITYYALLSAGLLLLVTTLYRLRAKEAGLSLWVAWALFGLAILVGIGESSVLSMPVREYSHYSIRGAEGAGLTREYATNWSFHPLETLTFLVPAFFGFGNQTYWGWMPFNEAPHYMGILPLLLAAVGFVLCRRDRFAVFFLVLGVFGLFVAFGKEFPVLYDPMFNFLPYFNKFRVPSMALVMTQLSVAILAALGIDRLLAPGTDAERTARAATFRKTLVIFGLVFLGAGFTVLFGKGWLTSVAAAKIGPQAADAAVSRAGREFLLVLLFFAAGAGVLLAYLNRALPRAAALALLMLITLADLWVVGLQQAHYQTVTDQKNVFAPTGTVEFLRKDPGLFRIMPLNAPLAPSPNWWCYFKLYSAHGYHPAKVKVYQDMLDDQGALGLTNPLRAGNLNFMKITNVKYMIFSQEGLERGLDVRVANVATGVTGGGQTVAEYTYELNNPLPRMFFVDRVRVIADPQQTLRAMADPAWDPASEAFVTADPGAAIDPAGEAARAEITEYGPHHIKANVTATGTNFLFLSEVYYPEGWTVRLDGRDVPVMRTNYGFRGIVVPPGAHALTLDFSDPAFVTGKTVSLASYGFVLLTILGGFVLDRRRKTAA